MKKTLSLSLIIIFSSLIINGCGSSTNEGQDNKNAESQESEVVGIPNEDEENIEDPKETQGTDIPDEFDADTVLDNELFDTAVGDIDLEKCNEISNKEKSSECLVIVKSKEITQNAINQLDETLCKEIEHDRYRESCSNSVTELITKNTEREEEFGKLLEDNDKANEIQNEANEKGDYSICMQIENSTFRDDCLVTVIVNNDENENNCSNIKDQSKIEICTQEFVGEPSL